MGLGIESVPSPPRSLLRIKIKLSPPSNSTGKDDGTAKQEIYWISGAYSDLVPAKNKEISPPAGKSVPVKKVSMKKKKTHKTEKISPAIGGGDLKPVTFRTRKRKGTPKRSPMS